MCPWASDLIPLNLTLLVRASLVVQTVKSPPAIQETWVGSLGWDDPLEEGMATHSSILAWRILMDRGARQATGHGVTKSWTRQRLSTHIHLLPISLAKNHPRVITLLHSLVGV